MNAQPSAFKRLDLTDRTILVTGGGQGLGRATAELVAARGANVIIADHEEGPAKATVDAITSSGGAASMVVADLTTEAAVQDAIEGAVREFGGLHGAFNNAGIASKGVPIADVDLADWDRTIAINLTAIFLCVKHELRHMLANGGGSIVNMSSAMAKSSVPNIVDYAASKSGVLGITRVAAAENSARGVRVNAVLPGAIETRLLAPALEDPSMRQAMESGHPIGRYGQPHEVAETVAWLLSDASSFITGAAYEIDGGYTAI